VARFRTLLREWKLAGVAVFSLSIALALGMVGISVSNFILLRPPAAADPGRLVTIYHRSPEKPEEQVSYPAYRYYRDHARSFEVMAAYPNSISKTWMEDRGEAVFEPVSDNYFSVMGMRPVLGRFFSRADDNKRLPEAVLTYACWRRWGSDPNIVGKTLPIDGGVTVVGVAPREFTGVFIALSADLVVPVSTHVNQDNLSKRDEHDFTLIGRLKPGVSRKQANVEMQALAQQLAKAFPQTDKGRVPVLTRAMVLPPDAIKDAELISAVFMILVLLVVLVACANVANLLLALAVKRRQETLIKAAIGATRRALVRQFLIESTTLCVLGGVAGCALASIALRRLSGFSTMLPLFGNVNIATNLNPDVTVAILAVALVLVASLATGLPGALSASSPHLAGALSGEIAIGGRRKGIIRNSLVVIQVSVCTLVMVGLGLCLRSAYNLRRVDPGFSSRNILGAVVVDVQTASHSEVQEQQLYKSLVGVASQIYGVESVSLANGLPFAGGFNEVPVELPGEGKSLQVSSSVVDDNYFATLGVPLFRGRVFSSVDRKDGQEVVVINRKLAETLWPNQEALGKTMRVGKSQKQVMVVGVAGNGKYNDLDEATKPFFYYALSQHEQPQVQIIVRTNGDPRLWAEPLTRAVKSAGFMVPMPPFTMGGLLYLEMLAPLLTLYVVGGLSVLGVLLAVVGLYGAVSYSVSERKRELGIRSALGAAPSDLFGMVLREITTTVGSGIAAGALIGAAATVLLRSQLFGIQALEWVVLLPVIFSMVGLAALVSCLAARSWVYGDPLEAVRHS
jgi:predicted permease